MLPYYKNPTVCVRKLDRLPWVDGFAFGAYGLKFGVRSTDANLLDALREKLPYGSRPLADPLVQYTFSIVAAGGVEGAPKRRFHLLYSDAVRIGRTPDLETLVDMFESNVRLVTAEYARNAVFVHAGVVGWKGKAILIPGRSFSGKTSLVAELIRAGATYYSDEFAVLTPDGRVRPFLKPLSMRLDGTGRQTDTPVEAFGAKAGKRALPVGSIFVTEYQDGGRWQPRPLSPGHAALALLEHTVPARRRPADILPVLHAVALGASAFKSRRGEADGVARKILDSLE